MKKILCIFLGLLLVFVVAVASVIAVIDPNDFKPLLVDEVKKATGRELVIDGDINWRFWPSLGLSIDKLAIKNPTGFAESNILSLESVAMSVSVMPLLSSKLDIGIIKLYGARVFIQTLADGRNNLDGFSTSAAIKSEISSSDTIPASSNAIPASSNIPISSIEKSTAKRIWDISIEGLDVLNASATIRNDKTGIINQISTLNLDVGKLATGLWVPIVFNLDGKQNEKTLALKGSAEVMFSKNIKESRFRHLGLFATLNSQDLKLANASLKIDQFELGAPVFIDIALKGKNKSLSFDVKFDTSVQMNETITQIEATNINGVASLFGQALPKQSMTLDLKGNALIDTQKQTVIVSNLAASVDELLLSGNASIALAEIPVIRFDLKSDKIDLDAFLGIKTSSVATSSEPEKTLQKEESKREVESGDLAPLSNIEPDLSALNMLDLAGKISITQFIVNNVLVTDVMTNIEINAGKLSINPFLAKLYEGTIDVNASLDASVSPARYHVKSEIKNVNIQDLLIAATNQKILSATGNIEINLRGSGLSPKALRSDMAGTVAINFADGSIAGINIPEMIREAKARLRGKSADYIEETKKTDFSALTATFNLGEGNAATQDMKLEAAGIRVQGEGVTNLLKQTLDFNILTSLIARNKGQEDKDINEFKDLTIPVLIGGTWKNPTYKLDLKAMFSRNNRALKEKARQEGERGLKKLLGDKADNEKIKEMTNKLLNSLFN